MYFRYFVIISPWKRAVPFIWTNSNLFIQGCFVPILVENGSVILEKKFFHFVNVFTLFRNYLPLEKGGALHLNKLESPSLRNTLCQVWLKLAQWFWRRRRKCEKFTDRQTDRQTDGQMDRRTDRQTTCDQKSSP